LLVLLLELVCHPRASLLPAEAELLVPATPKKRSRQDRAAEALKKTAQLALKRRRTRRKKLLLKGLSQKMQSQQEAAAEEQKNRGAVRT
jgi:hypothetical protein